MTNELATQHAIMTSTTPKNVIKTRTGYNGKTLSYVSTDYVIRTLNKAFGFNWDFIILDEKLLPSDQDPREVVVKGQLTIHGPNGQLVKSQFGGSICKKHNCYSCKNDYKKKGQCQACDGTGKGDFISIADDLKGAASDAFKKCASMLGVALDLYGTTPEAQPDPPAQASPAQAKPKPAANGNGGSTEARQLYVRIKKDFDLSNAQITALIKSGQWDKITRENTNDIYVYISRSQNEEIDF